MKIAVGAAGAAAAERSADVSEEAAAQDKSGGTSRSAATATPSGAKAEPEANKTTAAASTSGTGSKSGPAAATDVPDSAPGASASAKTRATSGPGEASAAAKNADAASTSAAGADEAEISAISASDQGKTPAPTEDRTSAPGREKASGATAPGPDSPAAQQDSDDPTVPAENSVSTPSAADKARAIDAKTTVIRRPGTLPPPAPGADDHKTVAIPRISPADAATTVLPVQPGGAAGRQSAQPTEKIPMGPAVPRPAGAPSPADVKATVPAELMSESRPLASPQRVPPAQPADAGTERPRRNRRLLWAGAAVVVVLAVVAVLVGVLTNRSDDSPSAQVRNSVTAYTKALAGGDLADLRNTTCGKLHDFYQNIAPDQYAGVHKLSVDQKKIPKVSSIDTVQITGDKAVAQASIYTDSAPNTVSARTFDLQQTPSGWKVCDPPGTPQ